MAEYAHELQVTVEPRGDVAVARITGSVDTITADDLLTTLQTAITGGHIRLVGDFEGVSYTSSAGLRTLLAAMKEARRSGGDLRLASVGERVLKVLELSGFTSILRLYPDVDTAVASYA